MATLSQGPRARTTPREMTMMMKMEKDKAEMMMTMMMKREVAMMLHSERDQHKIVMELLMHPKDRSE
jgi:hypothetical protein